MTTEELVRQTATQYGVPPDLAVAVARQESGLNQSARGSAGEVGVFQLMPQTAASLGVNPYDQTQNVQGGILFLKQMYDRFGNWASALSAYNAGPGAVTSGKVPSSTQSYVSKILAMFTPEIEGPQISAGEGTPVEAEVAGLSPTTTLILLAAIVGIGLLIARRD